MRSAGGGGSSCHRTCRCPWRGSSRAKNGWWPVRSAPPRTTSTFVTSRYGSFVGEGCGETGHHIDAEVAEYGFTSASSVSLWLIVLGGPGREVCLSRHEPAAGTA